MATFQKAKQTAKLSLTCSVTPLTETRMLYWCSYYNRPVKEIATRTRIHSIPQIAPLPSCQDETSSPTTTRAYHLRALAPTSKTQVALSKIRTRICCSSIYTKCSWCSLLTRPRARRIVPCVHQWSQPIIPRLLKNKPRILSSSTVAKCSQSSRYWKHSLIIAKWIKMIRWINWIFYTRHKDLWKI